MSFFKETALYKEMLLLEFISNNKNISQLDIAHHINSSVSMTNGYIDKFQKQGYLKREYQSKKVVHYNITSEGTTRKQYLQISYVRELMLMYQKGEETVSLFLDTIINKDFKEILLYGAGDVANIMLDMINNKKLDLKVVGIIDDNESKIGKHINGINIIPLNDIYSYNHDGVVITSFAYEDDIVERLININYSPEKIVRYFEKNVKSV